MVKMYTNKARGTFNKQISVFKMFFTNGTPFHLGTYIAYLPAFPHLKEVSIRLELAYPDPVDAYETAIL